MSRCVVANRDARFDCHCCGHRYGAAPVQEMYGALDQQPGELYVRGLCFQLSEHDITAGTMWCGRYGRALPETTATQDMYAAYGVNHLVTCAWWSGCVTLEFFTCRYGRVDPIGDGEGLGPQEMYVVMCRIQCTSYMFDTYLRASNIVLALCRI